MLQREKIIYDFVQKFYDCVKTKGKVCDIIKKKYYFVR